MNTRTFPLGLTQSRLRVIAGALFGIVLAAGVGTAVASWITNDSSANAIAAADTLAAPTAVDATASGSGAITVSWTLPGAQVAGAQYRVTRSSGPGSPLTVCTVSTSSCNDTGLTGGTAYGYQVAAILSNWSSPAGSDSATTPKANQTITFATLPNKRLDESPVTASATATSGLAVTFTSATTSVCTVSGSTVTFVTAGTCTINANQAGNTNWNAAPQVQQSFNISKGNQTITFGSLSNKRLDEGPVTVSATASSGLAVAFTSATPPVCTVSGSTVTFVTVGTCTINADQTGNTNWHSAPQVQQSFTISKGNQTITFGTLADKTFDQSPVTVSATASSGLAVTFTSATTSVCTVSGSTVTFVTVGLCTVNANQSGSSNWNAASQVQQSFTISKGNQTITFGALTSKTFDQGPVSVSATASSSLAVGFTSATTSVCTVSGTTVSFVTVGTCTVNADQAGTTNWNAAPQVQRSFTISKGNQTITFGPLSSRRLDQGPITVGATASSGLAVGFTSATTSVCTVSGTTVSFVTVGTCTVNANQAGDTNWNAAPQVQQSFTITKGNQTVSFTSTAPSSAVVGGSTYAASASATSGLTPAITSATTSVCTISGSTVTFVGAGTCTLNANQSGDSNWNTAPQVQQSFTVGKGSQTVVFTSTAPGSAVVGGATYTATAGSTSGLAVTITSATTSVCTISGSTVTFVGAGTCTLNANQSGDSNWNPAPQVQQSFTVGKGSQTISFTAPTSGIVGGTATLSATGGASGNPVTFTSATTSICTVSGTNGSTVTYVAAGTCTINANQAGNTNYNAAPQVSGNIAVASFGITSANNTSARKYTFSGAGGTSASTVNVTVCKADSFPCSAGNFVTTLAATVAANGTWTSAESANLASSGTQLWAQAVQVSPSKTSASFGFTVA